MGLMCSDHLQPGSQVILSMDISPNLTISMLAFGGVRVSSGALKLFTCEVDMVDSSFSSFDILWTLCLKKCPAVRRDSSGARGLPSNRSAQWRAWTPQTWACACADPIIFLLSLSTSCTNSGHRNHNHSDYTHNRCPNLHNQYIHI